MKSLSRIALLLSIVTFAVSMTATGSKMGYGVLKPLSALSFIVFFISNLLKNEFVEFDEEHGQHSRGTKRTLTASRKRVSERLVVAH